MESKMTKIRAKFQELREQLDKQEQQQITALQQQFSETERTLLQTCQLVDQNLSMAAE